MLYAVIVYELDDSKIESHCGESEEFVCVARQEIFDSVHSKWFAVECPFCKQFFNVKRSVWWIDCDGNEIYANLYGADADYNFPPYLDKNIKIADLPDISEELIKCEMSDIDEKIHELTERKSELAKLL